MGSGDRTPALLGGLGRLEHPREGRDRLPIPYVTSNNHHCVEGLPRPLHPRCPRLDRHHGGRDSLHSGPLSRPSTLAGGGAADSAPHPTGSGIPVALGRLLPAAAMLPMPPVGVGVGHPTDVLPAVRITDTGMVTSVTGRAGMTAGALDLSHDTRWRQAAPDVPSTHEPGWDVDCRICSLRGAFVPSSRSRTWGTACCGSPR